MRFSCTCITESKDGKPEHNEDCFGFLGDTYWVLDGATSPLGMKIVHGLTAKWYVSELSRAIARAVLRAHDAPLREILRSAIRDVSRKMGRGQLQMRVYSPSATVVMVRLADTHLEYVVLGDSYLLINTPRSVMCVCDDRIRTVNPARRAQALEILRNGAGFEDERFVSLKLQLVEEEHALRNRPGGYWIASADPSAADEAYVGQLAYTELSSDPELLLSTDGFVRGYTTYDIFHSWGELLMDVRDHGPAHVLAKVRQVELADPGGLRFPRMSRTDDATAVYLRIEKRLGV